MKTEQVVHPTQGVHATAVIHPGARIGENVEIGPYAVIGEHVEIGDGTSIGAHAVIDGWTTIGKNCKIFHSCSIGCEPQDLKFKGEKSYTIIGDNTMVREYATIHRATGEDEVTKVGSNCLLMAYTHLAHNCVVGNNVIMSNAAMCAGHAIVEDRAVIGGMAGVHQFVKIGRNAMVGGLSKITQDIPPFVIVDGNPSYVAGLNSVGMSRAGISPEARRNIKKAYKILFRSGLSLAEAIAVIEQDVDSCEEIEHFVRFLRGADRGICRMRRDSND